jgi:hypothetical protein
MSYSSEPHYAAGSRYSASGNGPSFKTLRILCIIISVIAIIAAAGFAFACVALFRSPMLTFYGSLGILIVGQVALIGIITVTFLLAVAETIKVLLAIEDNTRNSNDILRRKSWERQEATAPVNPTNP